MNSGDSLFQEASSRVNLPSIGSKKSKLNKSSVQFIDSMLFSRQQVAKPVRDKITSSVLNNPAPKLSLFESSLDQQKIEVRDGRESNVFSPKTGVTFLKGQNSTIDWTGDVLDIMIEGTDTNRYSSIQASSSGLRPGSHR